MGNLQKSTQSNYPLLDAYHVLLGRYSDYEEFGLDTDIATFTDSKLAQFLEVSEQESPKYESDLQTLFYPSVERGLRNWELQY